MSDLQKVIKGLKCCELIHRGGLLEESCNLCPYQQNKNQTCEAYELFFDARQHLKDQEPRVLTLEEEPIKVERHMEETEWNVCGNCGSHVIHKWAYCPYCGKRLKWDD